MNIDTEIPDMSPIAGEIKLSRRSSMARSDSKVGPMAHWVVPRPVKKYLYVGLYIQVTLVSYG